jgi:hypothetical protein
MNATIKESIWKQFGAGIDMLKHVIQLCPEEYWLFNKKMFYQVYHCLLFLDYYLTIPPDNFSSPLSFTFTAPEHIPVDAIDDLVPDRMYSKKELLSYLQLSREKCYTLIMGLTEKQMSQCWIEKPDQLAPPGTMNYTVMEILLYNMRHVQHHTAQLNLLLRQGIGKAAAWPLQPEDE